MTEQIFLFIASYIANTMSALAGGGAGLIQFPIILWLGDFSFPVALVTHKIATVALGGGAILRLWQERDMMDWKFGLFLILTGVLGAIIGAIGITFVPDKLATVTVGVLTVALAIYSMFQKKMGQEHKPRNMNLTGLIIGGVVIFLIGIMNGSISAGSGLFVTVFLILWWGQDYKRAVAYTMTFVGFFWNATGALTLLAVGSDPYWPWVPVLIIASLLGGYTGVHLGMLKGNKWIKIAFVSVTLLSGVSLLFK
jgi:uncharacterized membrane protein YfcA